MARDLVLSEAPEHMQFPNGPYRQAPAEYGGQWWLVTPFSDPKPWLKGSRETEADSLPDGVVEIYGSRPQWKDYRHLGKSALITFEGAKVTYDQDVERFQGLVTLSEEQLAFGVFRGAFTSVADMHLAFVTWDMGMPVYYRDSLLGLMGRFVDSALPDYDMSYHSIATAGHNNIADFQEALWLRKGLEPARWHPFVSPVLIGKTEKS